MTLDTTIRALVALEEGDFSQAKKVVGRRVKLRDRAASELSQGETLSEKSRYYALLREIPGRVSYKKIVENIQETHPDLAEEIEGKIEEYRNKPQHRLLYGPRGQLPLFPEE